MADQQNVVPARQVIEEAIAVNNQLGHENLGSLSYSHGFLPIHEPIKHLPSSHQAWDEIARAIPSLFRNYAVRKTLDGLPVLSADEADLPDEYLLRASSLFSILAHLYWYCEPETPETGIPEPIQTPWEQISKRLDRPAPHLSFIDLNSHNWHFIDPNREQPFVVENLKLAIPLIGNEDERRFQVTPIEMLYGFSPVLEAMIRAQEAVVYDEPDVLKDSLIFISDAIKYQTYISLMKVNPNPYSDLYINPVVWGKTAALFASPFQPNNSVPGPSGTAIPSFTSLDIFFGRKRYQTTVGHETDRTRHWFPKHWRDWLVALEAVSISDYVMEKADRTLKGIYDEARDAYAGESGILNRHRLKAYGFLDLSFKAGRVKTLGGVGGTYSERIWDRMATELDESRLERYGSSPQTTHLVSVKRVDTLRDHERQFVKRVVFDISGTGIRYQAGDRCGILPENSDTLVDQTLNSLQAKGDEIIHLNAAWRWHVNLRDGFQDAAELPLRMLLKFGRIRPVDRAAALNLYGLTNNERLRKILDAWAEDQWELWDLLNLVAEAGYNPKRLWRAIPGDFEHICRLIFPERWRLYSISSVIANQPDELHMTIGGLHYHTPETNVSHEADRWGTSSSFLTQLSLDTAAGGRRVSIKIVHPARFSLPQDSSRPLVMFAGGTGIAPMRGLIDERMRQPDSRANWLFFGTRRREDFYYKEELESFIGQGKLDVRVAFSQDDIAAQFNAETGHFDFLPGQHQHLDEELLKEENAQLLWDMLRSTKEGGLGAYFYLCGRTSFTSTILETIKQIIARYTVGETQQIRMESGRQTLYRLIGEDRLMLEIFTTYTGPHFEKRKQQFNISDVVLHNNDEHGYWIIISGRVYNMNEFNHLHPGGMKIIQSYAGMDGTVAYQKIEHHVNSEVDAMLGMYELGVIRNLDFGQEWGVALSDKGLRLITLRDAYFAWVDLLYMVMEIENALLNDFRVRHEPLTDIEMSGQILLTSVKVHELALTHERLVTNYLNNVLGEPMTTLWGLTIGLLEQKQRDAAWMRNQLDGIHASEAAQTVIGLAHALRTQLKQDTDRVTASNGYVEDQYGALCDLLQVQDCRVIHDLKIALREGVLVFEELEQDTIRHGCGRLLEVLQSIPPTLASFYNRLCSNLEV